MSDALDVLDPLTLPLHGSRLIEASAGTGKTWTIAALYVRLVLGHGEPGRTLAPGEILVMTFTKAATRELSERIRGRLVQTAARFRGEAPDGVKDDPFLDGLLAAFPEGPARQQAAWRLAMAAEAMDDAAIHTIDAWCQRMLREHAFDSGCLFDEELQPNEAAVLADAVRDYWRQQVYPIGGEALDTVLKQWPDVEALEADLRSLIDKPLPAGEGAGPFASCVERAERECRERLAALKAGWSERAKEMQQWLDRAWDDKDHPARKGLPKKHDGTRWIEALKSWARDPALEQPDVKSGAERLSLASIRAAFAHDPAAAIPTCFAEFDALMAALKQLPQPGPALRLHAAAGVRRRMQQLKAQAGAFGFADMLNRLDLALDETVHGAKARSLRERILRQYPAALIDEFQDTSPVQLRIFDRLYRIAENDASRALLLIGDPKQAIYAFRGADIHSYLQAREATRGRHHVLGTNHRSTTGLVEAVNRLFLGAEQRLGEGAFRFRAPGAGDAAAATNAANANANANADIDTEAGIGIVTNAGTGIGVGAHAGSGTNNASALPFAPVHAKGRPERLVCAAGDVPAVTLVADGEVRKQGDAQRLFAELCAERIVTQLNDPKAGFVEPDQPFRRLRPADIAVLVRTGAEAEAVRRALRRRGLPSVYLSDKDTVFQTPEAGDLLRLLQAVASPRDVRLARAALATALLGLSLPELLALASDDERFDRQCLLLQQLNADWRSLGVLAMLRRALHAFGLPARWLGAPAQNLTNLPGASSPAGQGERRLTNVLHLAELLQAASTQVEGEQALIRWLARQIDEAGSPFAVGDDLVLRLESDADLVQVVTVHKSKGLEYPLVFLPFPALFRESERSGDAAFLLPDGPGRQKLVLAPTPEQFAARQKEEQREALRLLYVALTRACHALWVGVAGVQVGLSRAYAWHRCALGYLVSGGTDRPPEQRLPDLHALAAACPHVTVQPVPLPVPGAGPARDGPPRPPVTPLQPREALPALAPPPTYDASFERGWSISSYSALVRDIRDVRDVQDARDPRERRDGRDGLDALDAPDAHEAARASLTTGMVPAARLWREDEPMESEPMPLSQRPADEPWHRFPRGAFAGNFLHDQLEWLAGEGFALDTSASVQEALRSRCERQGWGHRADDVLQWLGRVCAAPVPALGVPLARLAVLSPEMEFWFPTEGLQARQVDALCRQHLLPGRERPPLPERALSGMLMGFADLVFAHAGSHWVLDYKSNALGARDADYTAEAMAAAVLVHRYDVQAALYLLALHRLLQARLGAGYDPARHVGGAVVLFLRGVSGPAGGCCHLQAPAALLAALDALLPRRAAGAAREMA
ncbi:MAG: exodeoxyribonuclease V subunit beta [Rubrivivax sp.]|nr:exodeoxyribonuclease V subunit beta [Rubrivivax sp.]